MGIAAFALAGVALWVVANAHARSQRHVEILLTKTHHDRDLVGEAVKKVVQLAQTDFIHQHLRQNGVLPYLDMPGARILADIEATKQHLRCNDDQAIAYLKAGYINGPESGDERRDGSAVDDHGS